MNTTTTACELDTTACEHLDTFLDRESSLPGFPIFRCTDCNTPAEPQEACDRLLVGFTGWGNM
jgi:hypothetical protein